MEPQFRFCTSADGTRIAYATYGSGPPLLFANVFWISMGAMFTQGESRAFMDALAARMTLVAFDHRGTGASARDVDDVSPAAEAGDIEAVADAAGLRTFTLFTAVDSLAAAAHYAIGHEDRIHRVVLWGTPTAVSPDWIRTIREDWSVARRLWAGSEYPEGPVSRQRAFSQMVKEAESSDMAARRFEALNQIDFAAILPAVTAPALVLAREEPVAARQRAMSLARLFPNAEVRFVPGVDLLPFTMHQPIVEAIEQFVGVQDHGLGDPGSGTAIILFTDIVDSTTLTEHLGDIAFRAASRTLDERLRAAIRESGGAPVDGKVLGDGVMAVFSSAAQAIEAARRCIELSASVGADGRPPLRLHVGLHAGDVIREKDPGGQSNVYGGAVNIASRICGLSEPGEILVSQTIRDLARTSAGATFEDRGEHALKGIEDPVRVFAVRVVSKPK
jgi:class 3 adenylate cyclase/pimeloyl-ACP methyl ester carboxylesterase